MTVLLDTHILLWALTDSDHLSDEHRQQIVDPTNVVLASAVSIAEIAIKSSINKLTVAEEVEADNYANLLSAIADAGIDFLSFTAQHATYLRTLPFHHRDPFDRMIISQAIHENYPVLTADTLFSAYPVDTM